ncbi:MAG: thioredoxin family protein [Erysipelotrichaceae bacterium]
MKLFGKKKVTTNQSKASRFKVLGSGCAKCEELERVTREAMDMFGLEDEIEHVTSYAQIAAYGVIATPALVIDGKVVSCGKTLSTNEVVSILKKVLS